MNPEIARVVRESLKHLGSAIKTFWQQNRKKIIEEVSKEGVRMGMEKYQESRREKNEKLAKKKEWQSNLAKAQLSKSKLLAVSDNLQVTLKTKKDSYDLFIKQKIVAENELSGSNKQIESRADFLKNLVNEKTILSTQLEENLSFKRQLPIEKEKQEKQLLELQAELNKIKAFWTILCFIIRLRYREWKIQKSKLFFEIQETEGVISHLELSILENERLISDNELKLTQRDQAIIITQSEIDAIEQEICEKTNRLESLTKNIKSTEQSISKLEKEIENTSLEIKKVVSEIETLTCQINSL